MQFILKYIWWFCTWLQLLHLLFPTGAGASSDLHEPVDCDCLDEDSFRPDLLIPPNYDKDIVPVSLDPMGKTVPVKVFFAAKVHTVSPIVAAETEFRIAVQFVVKWVDNRLTVCNNNNLTNQTFTDETMKFLLTRETADKLWLPNPFITNAKYAEIKKLDKKLLRLSVSPNGVVSMNFMMNATVDCAMKFESFPLDSQMCPMKIESYSYDDTYVDFHWMSSNPIEVVPTRLLQFDVSHNLHYKKLVKFRTVVGRNFTRLVVYFRFDRLLGSHMIRTFIPCSLIVILSWFNFWLELEVMSARASLLMTAMLTLVTQFSSLRADLPPVAYVKGVDIWMFGCMFLIYAAMAEFILVKILYSITEEIRRESLVQIPTPTERSANDILFFPLRDILLSYSPQPVYQKKRLGSVVLSGRSIATDVLPEVTWVIGMGISVPLVWSDHTKSTEFNSERMVQIKTSAETTKVLWREIDIVSRTAFPIIFVIFSSGYWILLYGVAKLQSQSF